MSTLIARFNQPVTSLAQESARRTGTTEAQAAEAIKAEVRAGAGPAVQIAREAAAVAQARGSSVVEEQVAARKQTGSSEFRQQAMPQSGPNIPLILGAAVAALAVVFVVTRAR
jgi:hypothetical protein